MRVLFRTDSSVTMGSGHLMRCLTLANELRSQGFDIQFVSREHRGNLINKIESSYPVYRLPPPLQAKSSKDDYSAWLGVTQEQDVAETLAAVSGQLYDWLIVDHYGLDIHWEKRLRPVTKGILVIDDLANRQHDCDVLLDQNYFSPQTNGRYENLVPDSCRVLQGPNYALLQSTYAKLRNFLPAHDGQVRRVLVFFGGSDSSDETSKLLLAFNHPDLLHLVVDVVIGTNHPNPQKIINMVAARPATILHQNLPSLAGLMARADLFVGAGGATTWERMSLGLPSLVISVAENQNRFSSLLAEDGFQLFLRAGKEATSDEWSSEITQLINQPDIVKGVARKAKKLVDGLGTSRIARVLVGAASLDIQIRRAEPADEDLLFEWVNEPNVRAQSFQQDPISEEQHAQWFAARLNDSDSLILIGEDERGLPLGLVRFDIDTVRAEAKIGISIDSLFRGQGLSEILLRKSLMRFISIKGSIKFIAEIRDANRASQQLFKRLEFVPIPSRRAGAQTFELVL